MPRNTVDSAKAVALHKHGRAVKQIAVYFGVQAPCIYKAFRKEGYFTPGMAENRKEREREWFLPPVAKKFTGRPPRADRAANAQPIVQRDPCFRCGVRGDIGCRCPKAGVGWRVG